MLVVGWTDDSLYFTTLFPLRYFTVVGGVAVGWSAWTTSSCPAIGWIAVSGSVAIAEGSTLEARVLLLLGRAGSGMATAFVRSVKRATCAVRRSCDGRGAPNAAPWFSLVVKAADGCACGDPGTRYTSVAPSLLPPYSLRVFASRPWP